MLMLRQQRTLLGALARLAAAVVNDAETPGGAAGPAMNAELAKWCAPMPHVLLLLYRLTEREAATVGALATLAPFRAWLLHNPTLGGDPRGEIAARGCFCVALGHHRSNVGRVAPSLSRGDADNRDAVDVSTASLAAASATVAAAAAAEADAGSTDEDAGAAALRPMAQGSGVAEGMAVLAVWVGDFERGGRAFAAAAVPVHRCRPQFRPPRSRAAAPLCTALAKYLCVRGIAALQRVSKERGTLAA